MSYNKNLGKVKGDTGTTYIPSIITRNGKQYISFTSSDGTALPAGLRDPIEITPQVYMPRINDNNELEFYLNSDPSNIINVGNVKGDPGIASIGVRTVEELPNINTLTEDDKKYIYIIDNGDAYLDAAVFSDNKFVYLESIVRFNDYALLRDVYTRDESYSKAQIDNLLCNIDDKIKKINNIMGDTGAIVILDDE